MTFVPTTTGSTVATNVSPRARDLARTLEKSIADYQRRTPSTSELEVRQALMLVSRSRSPAAARAQLWVLLLVGILTALLAFTLIL